MDVRDVVLNQEQEQDQDRSAGQRREIQRHQGLTDVDGTIRRDPRSSVLEGTERQEEDEQEIKERDGFISSLRLPALWPVSAGSIGVKSEGQEDESKRKRRTGEYQAALGVAVVRVLQRVQGWLAVEDRPSAREGLAVPDCKSPLPLSCLIHCHVESIETCEVGWQVGTTQHTDSAIIRYRHHPMTPRKLMIDTLGSQDLRVVRHALAIVMYILNTRCLQHVQYMSTVQSDLDADRRDAIVSGTALTTPHSSASPSVTEESISATLIPLLSLLRPIPAPTPSPTAASSSSSSSAAPPPPPPHPPPLTNSRAMLGAPPAGALVCCIGDTFYNPSHPPAAYKKERTELLETINSLAPRVTLSALNGVLAFCRPGDAPPSYRKTGIGSDIASQSEKAGVSTSVSQSGADSTADRAGPGRRGKVDGEWYAHYPPYVATQTSRLLTTQLLRPGGIRALLENTLPLDAEGPDLSSASSSGSGGDSANPTGPGSVSGSSKAHSVAKMIARGPTMSTPSAGARGNGNGDERGRYVGHVLREAQVVFSPLELQPTLGNGGHAGNGQDRKDKDKEQGGQSKLAPRSWRLAMAEAVLQLEEGKEGDQVRHAIAAVFTQPESRSGGEEDDDAVDRAGTAGLAGSGDSNQISAGQDQALPLQARALAQIRVLALLQGMMQHSQPTPAFYRRGISTSLHSLMLLVLPPPSLASHSATPAPPHISTLQNLIHLRSQLARNVILLYSDLIDPIIGADAMHTACMTNVRSGKWTVSTPNMAGLTAWMEDIDRLALLERLVEMLEETVSRSMDGQGAVLGVHVEVLEWIQGEVERRLRGLREGAGREGQEDGANSREGLEFD